MTTPHLDKSTLELEHIAAASVTTPSANQLVLFANTSNSDHISVKNSSGTTTDLQAGASGTFTDSTLLITGSSDATKVAKFEVDTNITTGTTRTFTLPDANTTVVGTDTTQTLTNKTLQDSTTTFVDDGDATKAMKLQLSSITTATTRTLTVPDKSGTFAIVDTTTIFPKRATMWHDEATVTTGNALSYTVSASEFYNGFVLQSTSANGDTFTHSCWLAAGTYTFSILGVTSVAGAKIDWYIDNTIQASLTAQDWYSGSTVNNVVKTGSVTVVGDGYHVIKGVVNGRNASNSTAYNITLNKYWLKPSSD